MLTNFLAFAALRYSPSTARLIATASDGVKSLRMKFSVASPRRPPATLEYLREAGTLHLPGKENAVQAILWLRTPPEPPPAPDP
jgi:hypothetical protein